MKIVSNVDHASGNSIDEQMGHAASAMTPSGRRALRAMSRRRRHNIAPVVRGAAAAAAGEISYVSVDFVFRRAPTGLKP
jgi:hypothetical protein